MMTERTPAKRGTRRKEKEDGGWTQLGSLKTAKPDEKEKEDLNRVWTNREICKVCKHRVNSGERGLVCDMCSWWYHAKCEDISDKEYTIICEVDHKVRWMCQGCDGKEENTRAENNKLKETIDALQVEKTRNEGDSGENGEENGKYGNKDEKLNTGGNRTSQEEHKD